MGASLGFAAAGAGIAGGLGGLLGGTPASKVQVPQGYQLQNQYGADQSAYARTNDLSQYNIAGQSLPQYLQLMQSGIANPYVPGFQSGAGAAGGTGIQSGQNAFNVGGQVTGGGLNLLPDVQALVQLGFDPQNALYSKLFQQNTDQERAAEAARGVGTTPYATGLEDQSNQNFNIAWQNNLLNRAATGAGAAGSLLGNIGSAANTGQSLQASAAPQILQGAADPYNTFQGINATNLGLLNQGGQFGQLASNIPQQQIQDYLAYLNQGNSNVATANQSAQVGLNQANSIFNQNQILGGQIGGGLAQLGKAWGNSNNPFAGFFAAA